MKAPFPLCFLSPAWGVSVFIEINVLSGDASKGRLEQVIQQLASVDGVHGLAESRLARTNLLVHVVKAVSHGIDGVDDEAHFTILHIVLVEIFISCANKRKGHKTNKKCAESGVLCCAGK